jgi:predicted nuclease with TOPRIM domain
MNRKEIIEKIDERIKNNEELKIQREKLMWNTNFKKIQDTVKKINYNHYIFIDNLRRDIRKIYRDDKEWERRDRRIYELNEYKKVVNALPEYALEYLSDFNW